MLIDEGLKTYATERQKEFVDAVNEYGGFRSAARSLNINHSTIIEAIALLRRRAATSGYAPEQDMVRPVPEPFIVRGVSTYYNAEGKASGQWVKSKIDDSKLEETIRQFVLTLAEGVKGLAPLIEKPKLNKLNWTKAYRPSHQKNCQINAH
jgi:hypothetical protein